MKRIKSISKKVNIYISVFVLLISAVFSFPMVALASVNNVSLPSYPEISNLELCVFNVISSENSGSYYIDFPSNLSAGTYSFDVSITSDIYFNSGIDFVDWLIVPGYKRMSVGYWSSWDSFFLMLFMLICL